MLRAEEHICSVSHMHTAVKHAERGLDRYTTPTHSPLNLHASLSQSPSIDPPRMCHHHMQCFHSDAFQNPFPLKLLRRKRIILYNVVLLKRQGVCNLELVMWSGQNVLRSCKYEQVQR